MQEDDEKATLPLLNRAVRNSVFAGLGTVSTFVVGFLFAGLTIRYLGEARAGYMMTLQAVIGLNTLIGGLGLGTPLVRRVAVLHSAGDLCSARMVVGSVSMINILTGLLFSLLIAVFFPTLFSWSRLDPVLRHDAFWATLFIAGSFFLSQVTSAWQCVYQALQRYDLITVLTTSFGLLTGISSILVLNLAPSMRAIAATGFLIMFIRLVCDTILVGRLLGRISVPSWRWNEVRSMMGFGGWTYLSSLGGFLFTNLDRLVLTTFLGSASMPYYVVPQSLFLQSHAALCNQFQFIFPMFSSFGDAAVAQIGKLEDRLRWFMALISGALYTGIALMGPIMLSKIVNPEYSRRATIPLFFTCIQGFLHAQMIVPYFSSWAVGSGAPNTAAQLLNGTLVVLTAILLIPRFGYVGASIAQLWIGVVVLAHTLWVRRVLFPQSKNWEWLPAYISPCLMISIWFLTIEIFGGFSASNSIRFYISIPLGGISGLIALWLVERVVFPTRDRWTTLVRATEMPLSLLKRWVWAR